MCGCEVSGPAVVRVLPVSDPATLRHLAALIESRDPRRRALAQLSEAKLGELADMVARKRTPSLGWWRRALPANSERAERMAAAHAAVARLRDEWHGKR
jgi:hypothetical protein